MSDLAAINRLAFLQAAVAGTTGLLLGGAAQAADTLPPCRSAKRTTLKAASLRGGGC
jgi:hypothetical protein